MLPRCPIVSYLLMGAAFCADKLLIPARKDVYEFDLHLTWAMSMTSTNPTPRILNSINVLLYDVNKAEYVKRDKSGATCNATVQVSSNQMANLIPLDGLHHRIITINKQMPAHPLVVYKGAKVVVRVQNELMENGVTIHIHGMTQYNSWFMDGAAFITQCPIPSQSTFVYRFIADTPGTLYFHGHLLTDRSMGLVGPFIVLDDANDPTMVQYTMTIQDWPIQNAQKSAMFESGSYFRYYPGLDEYEQCWPPQATYDGSFVSASAPLSAILINDKGWHNQQDIMTRPQQLDLEVFEMVTNSTVLLRTIQAGRSDTLMVSVQDHKLRVVATDGDTIKPITVDMLILNPGERYDFEILAKPTVPCSTYHIVVENTQARLAENLMQLTTPIYAVAMLKYTNVPQVQCPLPDWNHTRSCSKEKPCTVLNCPWQTFPLRKDLHCLNMDAIHSNSPMPTELAKDHYGTCDLYSEYFLNFNYYVNGHRFLYPIAPPYANAASTKSGTNWIPCTNSSIKNCMYTIHVPYNSVFQLTVYNMGRNSGLKGAAHPLHMHGNHFYVIKQGFAPLNTSTGLIAGQNTDIKDCGARDLCAHQGFSNSSWRNGRVEGANLVDPPFKDTVVVPSGGYVVLRLKADNAGFWIAHCHVLAHHHLGMAYILQVGEPSDMTKPPSNFPMNTCGIFDPMADQPNSAQPLPAIVYILPPYTVLAFMFKYFLIT